MIDLSTVYFLYDLLAGKNVTRCLRFIIFRVRKNRNEKIKVFQQIIFHSLKKVNLRLRLKLDPIKLK